MTILWFWAFIFSAPVGFAAYLQADQPGWKIVAGGVALALAGAGFILFGLPGEMFVSEQAFVRHPDWLKAVVAMFVVVVAVVRLAGALIGKRFRARVAAARLDLYAFVAAFVTLNTLAVSWSSV